MRERKNFRFDSCIVITIVLFLQPADSGALETLTEVPFLYISNGTHRQHQDEEFRKNFDPVVPQLYHTSSDLRYLKGLGSFKNPMNVPFEVYKEQLQGYLDFLHGNGVRWVLPYFCNQTIEGNDRLRTVAWEVYDRWEEFQSLGLGPKPPDPLTWMQREPAGNLHYNYKRMCFLERGFPEDLIRYAPCPNNPDWRAFCNNEARLAAELGLDGFFVDNCIIHCYCSWCEERFQTYLKKRYTPRQLKEAFAADEYADVRLYSEGDPRRWAHTLPEFIPWLERRYPPEKRRIPFDTTGPLDPEHVDNAGGGMLSGTIQLFLGEKILPPGVQPTFENVRLANPALQSSVGRLRWAETMMFWADSIGGMLAEMRDAGRTENDDFLLIPNWGSMQRVSGATGRAEEGKDMRRWKGGGALWQFYEEGFGTGMIAPGLILEFDMELRYAFANGVRAMLLARKPPGEDVEELAIVEAAASGGGVLVDRFNYPDIQKRYQTFFLEHANLYEGYRSAARVGLAHLFDQVHYLNIEHLRQVHALNRYLADQQIPFDQIVEDDLSREGLSRYRAIVLPNVVFLDDKELDAIDAYVKDGGTLVLIGAFGTHDTYCREREPIQLAERFKASEGRIVRYRSISDVLPHSGMFLQPGFQMAALSTDIFGEMTFGKYDNLADLDKRLWIKRYQHPGPLNPVIANALRENPHLLDPLSASGVRNNVYLRSIDEGKQMVIHLVNKNVPLAVPVEERKFQPVRNLRLHVPLPAGSQVLSVRCFEAGQEPRTLTWKASQRGAVSIPFERLNAYAIISVEYRQK